MKFVLVLVILFIFSGIFSTDKKKSDGSLFLLLLSIFGAFSTDKKSSGDKRKMSDSHHPDDRFFIDDGLDHEIDDDSYCEECDDYHNR